MIGSNSKLFAYILIGLLGVSGLLYLLFVAGTIDAGLLVIWCYVLFAISVLASVIFPVIGMISDFKKAVRSLIGVAVLAIIFGIGFGLASDEIYTLGQVVVDETTSRMSEAGLITFYVMMVLAILTIIYAEISKAFK